MKNSLKKNKSEPWKWAAASASFSYGAFLWSFFATSHLITFCLLGMAVILFIPAVKGHCLPFWKTLFGVKPKNPLPPVDHLVPPSLNFPSQLIN